MCTALKSKGLGEYTGRKCLRGEKRPKDSLPEEKKAGIPAKAEKVASLVKAGDSRTSKSFRDS